MYIHTYVYASSSNIRACMMLSHTIYTHMHVCTHTHTYMYLLQIQRVHDALSRLFTHTCIYVHTHIRMCTFFKYRRVHDACAMMWPPIGFLGSGLNDIPSTCATTWDVQCVYVCERETERQSVCVCVRERESVCVCACACVRAWGACVRGLWYSCVWSGVRFFCINVYIKTYVFGSMYSSQRL
jgi:hypothetical protein